MISKIVITILLSLTLAACSSTTRFTSNNNGDRRNTNGRYGTEEKSTNSSVNRNSKTYYGVASYYAEKYNGIATANGETYNMYDLTAASKNLPFNTIVRVTNLDNHKSVILRINDRGPFVDNRIIDVSKKAAQELDMISSGTAKVRIDVIKWGK